MRNLDIYNESINLLRLYTSNGEKCLAYKTYFYD